MYCPKKCNWLDKKNNVCGYAVAAGVPKELEQENGRYIRPSNCKPSEHEKMDYYKRNCLEHWTKVRELLLRISQELMFRADAHDSDKLSCNRIVQAYTEPVFMLGNSDIKFGTEEYAEVTASMGAGWEEHYKNADHHIEHFANGIEGMNLMQIIEMLCDWKAAAERDGRTWDFERSWDYVFKDNDDVRNNTILKSVCMNTAKFLKQQT